MPDLDELEEIIGLTDTNVIDYLCSAEHSLKNITKEKLLKDYDFGNERISVAIISWVTPCSGQTNSRYIIDFDSRTIVDRHSYLEWFPERRGKLREMGWEVLNETPEWLKNKLASMRGRPESDYPAFY